MGVILDRYEEADRSFRVNEILTDSDEKLLEHLSGLSNLTNINTGTQHRDIIRSITINHILLHRHVETLQGQVKELHGHITALNTENHKTHRRVVALTIAALIAGGAQATTALLPYAGIVPTLPAATVQQTQPPKLSSPAPAKSLAADLPGRKAP